MAPCLLMTSMTAIFVGSRKMSPRNCHWLNFALGLLLSVPSQVQHCCNKVVCCSSSHSHTTNSLEGRRNGPNSGCTPTPQRGCRCLRQMASSFSVSQNSTKRSCAPVASVFGPSDRRERNQQRTENGYAVEPRLYQGRRLQIAFCDWRS